MTKLENACLPWNLPPVGSTIEIIKPPMDGIQVGEVKGNRLVVLQHGTPMGSLFYDFTTTCTRPQDLYWMWRIDQRNIHWRLVHPSEIKEK